MEIKPCRVCGSMGNCSKYPNGEYGVECTSYACEWPFIAMGDTPQEAIENWNSDEFWEDYNGN